MRNKLIFNSKLAKVINWILTKLTGTGIRGIVIFRTAYFPKNKKDTYESTIIHERTHIKQIKRDGMVYFIIKYLLELIINLIKYKNYWKAHGRISYEEEAFQKSQKK